MGAGEYEDNAFFASSWARNVPPGVPAVVANLEGHSLLALPVLWYRSGEELTDSMLIDARAALSSYVIVNKV